LLLIEIGSAATNIIKKGLKATQQILLKKDLKPRNKYYKKGLKENK
jgi:hypothetical protein